MNTRIAIVGATGLVGRKILSVMADSSVHAEAIGLFASEASAGTAISYRDAKLTVESLGDCDFSKYHVAMFCVGDDLSAKYVPQAVAAGCSVVDKSNAFRLDPDVPLVVAGVNDGAVAAGCPVVANPNCTTIVMSHALASLERSFGISSIWAATYQSASGAGSSAVSQLIADTEDSGFNSSTKLSEIGSEDSLAFNTQCRVGGMKPNGQCSEEFKLVAETKKILGRPDLAIVGHTVRVPVLIGHGIAVTVRMNQQVDEQQIVDAWVDSQNVMYMNDDLPTPIGASCHNQVEVGRLRSEPDIENGWSFFVCGDNINIGAALNGWRLLKLLQAAGSVPQFNMQTGGS